MWLALGSEKKQEPWESRMNWDREYWGLQSGWRKTIRRKRRRKSCGRPPYEAGGGDRLKWFGRVDWRTAPRARLLFAILVPYDIEREQS